MRFRIALIIHVLAGSAAFAQAKPPAPASFDFPSGSLSFDKGSLDFPAATLSFPSTLLQKETASTIEVELPADILFDFDKADIRPDASTALHEVGLLIREKARGGVTVNGYTDSMGSDSYNQRLSERRAASVRAWLATRESLGSVKFTTAGLGAKNPVAPNRNSDGSDNPEGRQRNRRVTLILQK
jgi:outer membrane protein OmpA-like peptidoglycan-associated protein